MYLAVQGLVVIAVFSTLGAATPLREVQDQSFMQAADDILHLNKREISLAQDLTQLFAAQDTDKVKDLLATIENVRDAADIISQSDRGKSNKVERAVIETLKQFFGKIGRRILNSEMAEQQLEQLTTVTSTTPPSLSTAPSQSTTSVVPTSTTQSMLTTSPPTTANTPTEMVNTTAATPMTDIQPTPGIKPKPRFNIRYILKLVKKLLRRFRFHRPRPLPFMPTVPAVTTEPSFPTFPTEPPTPSKPSFFGGFRFFRFRRFRLPQSFFSLFSHKRRPAYRFPFGGFEEEQ